MRSSISFGLVISLVGSAAPVAAQQHAPTGDPIARSISGEADRFATIQQSKPADPEWSRVRKLAPGTELIVVISGEKRAHRYLVAADEAELTVLNVGDPTLPVAARDALRDAASTHPQYFLAARKGGQFVVAKNVTISAEGVFVADRKVAELARVVERYGRDDIAAIATAATESNAVGCALAGYYGGGLIGGIPGALVGGAVGRDTGPVLLGMVAGWSVGAVHVFRTCRHRPEKMIYGGYMTGPGF
jgi:hypothetical protein